MLTTGDALRFKDTNRLKAKGWKTCTVHAAATGAGLTPLTRQHRPHGSSRGRGLGRLPALQGPACALAETRVLVLMTRSW